METFTPKKLRILISILFVTMCSVAQVNVTEDFETGNFPFTLWQDGGYNSPAQLNDTELATVTLPASSTTTYTIENNGTTVLNISSISSDNTDFTINGPVSTTVAPGSSTTFDVKSVLSLEIELMLRTVVPLFSMV